MSPTDEEKEELDTISAKSRKYWQFGKHFI